MTAYTLNDAWCSVEDARRHAPLFTPIIVPDEDVNAFIDEAVVMMQSKLRRLYDLSKFTLPLPQDLKQIRLLCARFAGYKIMASKPDKISLPDMSVVWELAIKELTELSEGRMMLPAYYLNPGVAVTSKGYSLEESGSGFTIRGALTKLPQSGSVNAWGREGGSID